MATVGGEGTDSELTPVGGEGTREAKVCDPTDGVNLTALALGLPECVICMEGDKTHLVFPCGHKCLCGGCAALIGKSLHVCPVCNTAAIGATRVWDT